MDTAPGCRGVGWRTQVRNWKTGLLSHPSSAQGKLLTSPSLTFLVHKMETKTPLEHREFKVLRFDYLASNSNSSI